MKRQKMGREKEDGRREGEERRSRVGEGEEGGVRVTKALAAIPGRIRGKTVLASPT